MSYNARHLSIDERAYVLIYVLMLLCLFNLTCEGSIAVADVLMSLYLQEEQDTDLYDEVTEDQYKSIVRGRLAKDDFVVDDGIGGYMDNGMDDWTGNGEQAAQDSDDDIGKKRM